MCAPIVTTHHWPGNVRRARAGHKTSLLAECVALWGEPEQAVHGRIERRAAGSSDMKGKRATI